MLSSNFFEIPSLSRTLHRQIFSVLLSHYQHARDFCVNRFCLQGMLALRTISCTHPYSHIPPLVHDCRLIGSSSIESAAMRLGKTLSPERRTSPQEIDCVSPPSTRYRALVGQTGFNRQERSRSRNASPFMLKRSTRASPPPPPQPACAAPQLEDGAAWIQNKLQQLELSIFAMQRAELIRTGTLSIQRESEELS